MTGGVNITSSIALHAAAVPADVALCSMMPFAAGADAPDWVQLLPAGPTIETVDGRGPYKVSDMTALAAASLKAGDRAVIDINHSTDLAAPLGQPAPAAGWIVALQARQDGLWGQVEWTGEGKTLVAGKAYRGISPALQVEEGTGRVQRFLRASLVNRPNIKNLTTLHSQETEVNPLLAKLLTALGLKSDTSEETLITAVTALHAAQTGNVTTLQSIAKEAGVDLAADKVNGEVVLNAVKTLKAAKPADATAITALQSELTTVTTAFNTLKDSVAKDRAIVFVDNAIKQGKVGLKPLREHYISMHMADPTRVEKEVNAMVAVSNGSVVPQGDPGATATSLNSQESAVAAQLGLTPEQFTKTRTTILGA